MAEKVYHSQAGFQDIAQIDSSSLEFPRGARDASDFASNQNAKSIVYIIKTTALDKVTEVATKVLNNIVETEQRRNKILLKPNAVGPYPPPAGVTTSPDLIKVLCQALCRSGYKVSVGDCPGESSGTTEEIFVKTGILAASGNMFVNLGQQASVVNFPCRKSKTVAIAQEAIDSDIVISLAKLKTSCFMMISGAVKNCYGIIPGTQKALIHEEFPKRNDFADMLIDLALIPKRTMAIIDGSTLMEGNGPVHGKVRTENIYIISEDIFAADYAVARLLGLEINDVPILRQAQKRGILSPENIEIKSGVEIPLPKVQLPITLSSYLREDTSTSDERVGQIATIKIIIDRNKCVGCGHCASVCPAKAISMNPYPQIDHKKCIRCFCCNELCPHGAANPEKDIKKLWDNIMCGESKVGE